MQVFILKIFFHQFLTKVEVPVNLRHLQLPQPQPPQVQQVQQVQLHHLRMEHFTGPYS